MRTISESKKEVERVKARDQSSFWWFSKFLNSLFLFGAIGMWVFTSLMYPAMDGIAIYQLMPVLPKQDRFIKLEGKSAADEAFVVPALTRTTPSPASVVVPVVPKKTDDDPERASIAPSATE